MTQPDRWPKRLSAITLFVDELAATKAFYATVFRVPMIFADDDSAVFDFGNVLANLLRREAATELIDPAEVGGPGVAARMQLTIDVDDVDAVCTELERLGVPIINGPIDRPWGPRTACFRDPAGHLWEVASS